MAAKSSSDTGCSGGHQDGGDLESYSLGRLALSLLSRLERHLLVCQQCRKRLSAIETCGFVHYTGDGPFYCRVTKLRTGAFFARHWGRSLEGGKQFRTRAGARAYLERVFPRVFPDHTCTVFCGPTNCVNGLRDLNYCYLAGQVLH
jgi:hypothetical protein